MSCIPYKPWKVLLYSILIWLIGFIWGTIVFMTPALMELPAVPYISKYPAISFPLIAAYFIIGFLITRDYLGDTEKKASEGLRFGAMILIVNFILDVLIYFILFKSQDYFNYFSIWFSYIMSIAYPWLIGRWLERQKGIKR